MNAFLLSVALLGDMPPLQDLTVRDTSRSVIQQREAANQNAIATANRESETKNTYIIAGAIVGGLFLFGLLARSGKKST